MINAENPLLLIKIPTRSRPERFFQILDKHYELLSGTTHCRFLITCDIDDITMNNNTVIEKLNSYTNLSYSFNYNKTKVEAYNRDLTSETPFDILLLSSDDMLPCLENYDQIIVNTMLESFPDFDGVLNFHDGTIGAELNTLPVIGKKFFNRFGYAYYPGYVSLFCDEELTLISRMLNKEKVCNIVILRHLHPWYNLTPWDDLYRKNESYNCQDKALFWQRKPNNFYLTEAQTKL